MYKYKIFVQNSENLFSEIAQTTFLRDAELLYETYEFGMISEVGGEILQTKLMPTDQPSLI